LLAALLALCVAADARAESHATDAAADPAEPQATESSAPAPTAQGDTPTAAPAAPPSAPPPAPMPVGNLADGEKAYAVCAICHLENGAGRPDGVFPQLAGQHATVVYQQIADIRDGRRENPIMYPFAKTLVDEQILADLARYIESLPLPADNGKGPGNDYALGAELYMRDCSSCHGERGQGNAERRVPMVASQHYTYLLRQINDIGGRHRGNADPKMVGLVPGYSPKQREAVADFISRLEESQQLRPAPE
jgi:cytochrome c553